MRLQELKIERPYTFSVGEEKMLKGSVTLTGEGGTVTVNLSPAAIGRICAQVAREVSETAKHNATQVSRGMENAQNEVALLGQIPSSEVDF